MIGREIAVSFFGYGKEEDRMFIPYSTENAPQAPVVALRTVQLEFPVLEYRPFRTFSMDQSSSMVGTAVRGSGHTHQDDRGYAAGGRGARAPVSMDCGSAGGVRLALLSGLGRGAIVARLLPPGEPGTWRRSLWGVWHNRQTP